MNLQSITKEIAYELRHRCLEAVDFVSIGLSVIVDPLDLLIELTLHHSLLCIQITDSLLKLIKLS